MIEYADCGYECLCLTEKLDIEYEVQVATQEFSQRIVSIEELNRATLGFKQ